MNIAIILLGIFIFCCIMAYFMPSHWIKEVDITNVTDEELEEIFNEVNNG